MSVSVSQQSSSLDPFLRQAAPLLQTYWNAISKITNQHLMIEKKFAPPPEPFIGQGLHIHIEISVPVVVVVENKGNYNWLSGHKEGQVKSTEEALSLVELVSVYNHKLEKVINAELKVKEEFKGQGSQLQRRLKKLEDLCKGLEEFSAVVDKILEVYFWKLLGFDVQGSLPSLEELQAKKKGIQTLQSKLKVDELHVLFEKYTEEFKTTEENILCDILGMNEDVGGLLFEMDIDMRMHEGDLYFLKRFVENKEDAIGMEELSEKAGTGRESLLKNLQKLGFRENCAATFTSSIPDEFVDLQKPSFWGVRYLEHTFAHHPLIYQVPRYPFNQENTDNWFEYDVPAGNRSEPEDSASYDKEEWPVRMINVASKPKGNTLVKEFLKNKEEDETSQLLFHGTCHKSALSILEEGITLSKGRDSQDFSSGDGFYLSESFENAAKWIRAATGQHQAVIVFKVDGKLLDADKENGLDLSNDREQWMEVVRLCRSGYNNKKRKKELLKGVSFIRGPMCLNPKERNLKGFGRDDCIQVCLRDEDYAERFGSLVNISCVIFY